MGAIEFLKQLEKLDLMIKNKEIEKQQWRDVAKSTTAQMTGERVQSSGNPHKMSDAIEKYIDLEKEIDLLIRSLIEKKREIIGVIENLSTLKYDILHKVYVQRLTLSETAEIYKRSYNWALNIHNNAIDDVQNIIDNRKEK